MSVSSLIPICLEMAADSRQAVQISSRSGRSSSRQNETRYAAVSHAIIHEFWSRFTNEMLPNPIEHFSVCEPSSSKTTKSETFPWNDLPNELRVLVMRKLSRRDVNSCRRVSRMMNEIVQLNERALKRRRLDFVCLQRVNTTGLSYQVNFVRYDISIRLGRRIVQDVRIETKSPLSEDVTIMDEVNKPIKIEIKSTNIIEIRNECVR
uniref:F-box domain-containing protein n=1 Tax=Heterorhabditis bacteriophora TaxID=37862 RepID=A0A1I7WZR0_HETBA